MINAPQLLADLTRQLKRLEANLLERITEQPELGESLRSEWQAARDAERCAETFETWADQLITQAGVHWLLSGVFLRFIEDNQLVDRPWLGGTPESGRLALARDRHEAYFREHPSENDRDYLVAAFREAGALPGLHTFFDEAHNPVFRLGIGGDAAMALLGFWQQVDPNTGSLVHDFADTEWNTRFLGDLYQDLSEATRKRYALLQTPEFVEEFILDRTLTPAIREFGFREVRMIDPTCGSGHFLLGGFQRLVDAWLQNEPGRNPVDLAQKALDGIAGVDLNPFAVAISRFRLLVAALRASGARRLVNAHDFKISVAIGDSLLHGTRFGLTHSQELFDAAESHADTGMAHAYASEDLSEVQRILGRQYHAVVGNPPYIVVKDAALNAAYRRQYASCHMKYSLGAPFTERFFELALSTADGYASGYVGLITANSFMKREFGSKLIEQVLPRLDLTHVVDTSGAYIPGHGTPTVILFGRHRAPIGNSVRTVMGIKGEPCAPDDPARGLVWTSIVNQIDLVDSSGEFVSVADTPRVTFGKHPWSIGGGGALAVKESIEDGKDVLKSVAKPIGFAAITGEDEAFVVPEHVARKLKAITRPFGVGDEIRDWQINPTEVAVFNYEINGNSIVSLSLQNNTTLKAYFWNLRTKLRNRLMFGKTPEMAGKNWWDISFLSVERLTSKCLIPFSFVGTHNHFAIDFGGKLFKQSAPVISLNGNPTLEDFYGITGVLNSSTACFWMKQVLHDKGNGGIGGGIASEDWERFYEFTGTALAEFPLSSSFPVETVSKIEALAQKLRSEQPQQLFALQDLPNRSALDSGAEKALVTQRLMIANQEELDWRCYRHYGLVPVDVAREELEFDDPPEVALGERAFEIVLARQLASGRLQTRWFERHGATPTTEVPAQWPENYRRVVSRRIELIEQDKSIGLIERPEFKRRWNTPGWQGQEQIALREWLLARLEVPAQWPAHADQPPQLSSVNLLTDRVSRDPEFMQIAALYAGHTDFDLTQLVAELVTGEAVPLLPVQRYSETGLRKRDQWQDTWRLQRREDVIDAEVVAEEADGWSSAFIAEARQRFEIPEGQVLSDQSQKWVDLHLASEIKRHQIERKANELGAIPVPPKYQSKDFLKAEFWRLRGSLDVPKERFVSFPGAERGADGSLPIAWAGWNHLQLATALAGYYIDMKDADGWDKVRLQPLLAGLLELVPWLKQWHNDIDPAYGARMGDYYEGFVAEEARALGFTLDDLRSWKPVVTTARRGRKLKQTS